MKKHTTRKEIKNRFNKIYSVGYCGIAHLLTGLEADFYNSGVFGWNWDGFVVAHDTVIITGYRNAPGKTIPYELTEKYNQAAAELKKQNFMRNWSETRALLDELLKSFLEDAERC